jgi:DNA-binding protein H-NS
MNSMATLTNDMARLCGEIQMMRRMRDALMNELEKKTRERRDAVSQMQANIATAHEQMATRTKANRMAFVSELKQTGAEQRQATSSDLAGANRAWSGKGRKRTGR